MALDIFRCGYIELIQSLDNVAASWRSIYLHVSIKYSRIRSFCFYVAIFPYSSVWSLVRRWAWLLKTKRCKMRACMDLRVANEGTPIPVHLRDCREFVFHCDSDVGARRCWMQPSSKFLNREIERKHVILRARAIGSDLINVLSLVGGTGDLSDTRVRRILIVLWKLLCYCLPVSALSDLLMKCLYCHTLLGMCIYGRRASLGCVYRGDAHCASYQALSSACAIKWSHCGHSTWIRLCA